MSTWSDLKSLMSPPIVQEGNEEEKDKSFDETIMRTEMEKHVELIQNKCKVRIQELRTKHMQEVTELRRRWLEARLELDRMDRQFEKMSDEYESKSKEIIAVQFGRQQEHENALSVSQAHKRTRRLLGEETARRKRVDKLLEATKDAMQKQKRNYNTMKTRYDKLRKSSRHFEYKENKYRIYIQNLEVERRDHMKRIYEANDTQEKMQCRIQNLESELTCLRKRLEREYRDNKLQIGDIRDCIETEDDVLVVHLEKEEEKHRVEEDESRSKSSEDETKKNVNLRKKVQDESSLLNDDDDDDDEKEKNVAKKEELNTSSVQFVEQDGAEKLRETEDLSIDVPCLASALQGWWKSVERKRKLGVR